MKSLLTALICILSLQGHADSEPGQFETNFFSDSLANDIEMQRVYFNYKNNRRNILWPYENSRTKADDIGFKMAYLNGKAGKNKFEGNKAQILYGKKNSPNQYTEVTLGPHVLRTAIDEEKENKKTILAFGFNQTILLDEMQIHLDYIHDYMYEQLHIPSGIDQWLDYDRLAITVRFKTFPFNSNQLRAVYARISDDNEAMKYQFSSILNLDYNLVSIWGGGGAEYGSFKYESANYSSPGYYYGFGPTFGASLNPHDGLSLAFSQSSTSVREKSGFESREFYRTLGIEMGKREKLKVNLVYVTMQSTSIYETWYDNQYNVSLQLTF